MGKRRIALSVLLAGSLGTAAVSALLPDPRRPQPAPSSPAAVGVRPTENGFAVLPRRVPLGQAQGELFSSGAAASPPKRATESALPQAEPISPPMPFRIAGKLVHEGTAEVVLARGDRVFIARPGDGLDDDYRLESVRADGVTIVYLPLNRREDLLADEALRLDIKPPEPPALANGEAARRSSISGRFRAWRRLTGSEQ